MSDSPLKTYIFGTGGLAREVYHWWLDCQQDDSKQQFAGFLAHSNDFHSDWPYYSMYLGTLEDIVLEEPSAQLFIALGTPYGLKAKLADIAKNNGWTLPNLVHPSALIGNHVAIGEGNIFCPNTVVTTNVNIGNNNVFNIGVTVGHDVVIGDENTFSSHVDVMGAAEVGNNNFFGSGSRVFPKAKVGNKCTISAGSSVYRRAKDGTTMHGNPARAT